MNGTDCNQTVDGSELRQLALVCGSLVYPMGFYSPENYSNIYHFWKKGKEPASTVFWGGIC